VDFTAEDLIISQNTFFLLRFCLLNGMLCGVGFGYTQWDVAENVAVALSRKVPFRNVGALGGLVTGSGLRVVGDDNVIKETWRMKYFDDDWTSSPVVQ
jgi:hypothetical protein